MLPHKTTPPTLFRPISSVAKACGVGVATLKLYLRIQAVHVLKSNYNQWISRKDAERVIQHRANIHNVVKAHLHGSQQENSNVKTHPVASVTLQQTPKTKVTYTYSTISYGPSGQIHAPGKVAPAMHDRLSRIDALLAQGADCDGLRKERAQIRGNLRSVDPQGLRYYDARMRNKNL